MAVERSGSHLGTLEPPTEMIALICSHSGSITDEDIWTGDNFQTDSHLCLNKNFDWERPELHADLGNVSGDDYDHGKKKQ